MVPWWRILAIRNPALPAIHGGRSNRMPHALYFVLFESTEYFLRILAYFSQGQRVSLELAKRLPVFPVATATATAMAYGAMALWRYGAMAMVPWWSSVGVRMLYAVCMCVVQLFKLCLLPAIPCLRASQLPTIIDHCSYGNVSSSPAGDRARGCEEG